VARVAKGPTPAIAALIKQNVPHILHTYHVSVETPDYGRSVAEALGVPAERVFKTLVAEVDDALTVAVVPVAGELDLKALAGVADAKRAVLADRVAAERATGYVRGGISPLGQRRRLPTVVDSSTQQFETILVSAGQRGLQVELSPADLTRLTRATVSEISRGAHRPHH
jgi:Cys-tRNA(Pro)/Cys-tRNA(Cys) deacylase